MNQMLRNTLARSTQLYERPSPNGSARAQWAWLSLQAGDWLSQYKYHRDCPILSASKREEDEAAVDAMREVRRYIRQRMPLRKRAGIGKW